MLFAKLNFFAMMLLQGNEVNFDLRSMWGNMGVAAKAVVILLAIMSAWSIGVMIDRYIAFSQARKQSREFAPAVAGCLKEGKIEEAISVAEQNKRSHLAKVVEAGLQEFRAHALSHELAGEQVESSRRACERAEAIVNAELKRGLSSEKTAGLSAVAGGISEALVTTAFGLFVAVPAVWAYNAFTNKVEAFGIEMTNSSSELIDYFIKQQGQKGKK